MLPSQLPELAGTTIALDTEGSGLHPDSGATVSVVSVAWLDDHGEIQAHAWPFDQGYRDKIVPSAKVKSLSLFEMGDDPNLDAAEWQALLEWVKRHPLVAHNVKYDALMLRAGTRHHAGLDLFDSFVGDTMLIASKLWPQYNIGLEDVAQRLFGGNQHAEKIALDKLIPRIRAKGATKADKRYDLVAWADMEAYAAADAARCCRIYHHEMDVLNAGELGAAQMRTQIEREWRLCGALYRMERRGIAYDTDRSYAAAAVLEERAAGLAATLPFRPNTNAAKAWYFGGKGQKGQYLPYAGVTAKGSVSLDEETMRKMVNDGLPHASTWQDITRIQHALSMWYEGYPAMCGADGRLRTNFNQTKVKSGRMSVSRVQLQAIPKKDKSFEGVPHIRQLFGARPGHVLFNLDLSQAELRVAAKYSGCTAMLEAVVGGADFHSDNARTILRADPTHDDWSIKRDIAKRLTFGGIFLIGGRTYAAQLRKFTGIEMPEPEADKIVRAWRERFPEFGRAYYWLERYARDHKYVWLLPDSDRGLQAQGWRSEQSFFKVGDWEHTAWSRVVQGSLATFNKLWLIETERWAQQLGVPEALVLNVHDSTVLELPESEAADLAAEFARRGAALATRVFKVPMLIDVKEGL